MIGTVMVMPWTIRAAESTPPPTADPPSARLLAKALEFRQQAQTDSETAFVRYVGNTDKAKKLFGFLAKTLCPQSDPAKGWTYFFETSIWSLSFPTSTTAAAVFYHPWSDVALVTEWTRKDTGTTLADADLIMGDALRNLSKPPFEIEPHWMRGPVPPYLAAGISSARTVRGFERIFATANKPFKDGWRTALQLGDAGLMETNHAGVGTMFERSLSGLTRYHEDDAMAPVRNQTRETLEQIRSGRFDLVYKVATETKPQVRTILKNHGDKWGDAKVITCVTKRDDQKKEHLFVLLSMPRRPECFMSFWFRTGANPALPPSLIRIDLIDQNQSYKYLGSIDMMNEAPERGDITRATIEYGDWVGRLITIGESAMKELELSASAGPVGSLLGGCCDELIGRTLWDLVGARRNDSTSPARVQQVPGRPASGTTPATPANRGPANLQPRAPQGTQTSGRPPTSNVTPPVGTSPPSKAPQGTQTSGRPPSSVTNGISPPSKPPQGTQTGVRPPSNTTTGDGPPPKTPKVTPPDGHSTSGDGPPPKTPTTTQPEGRPPNSGVTPPVNTGPPPKAPTTTHPEGRPPNGNVTPPGNTSSPPKPLPAPLPGWRPPSGITPNGNGPPPHAPHGTQPSARPPANEIRDSANHGAI